MQIYGYQEVTNKGKTWKLLKSLDEGSNCAWLVMGDLNEILDTREKWGGLSCSVESTLEF